MAPRPRSVSPEKGKGKGRTAAALLNIEEDLRLAAEQGAKGSLKVDDEELNAAFQFFDIDGKGRLTAKDLHARLSVFYPSLQVKDVRSLITKEVFTKEVLRRLLENNQLAGFDPVKQAFSVYDPGNTGFADVETLRRIFADLGFGEISDEDVGVLIEASDVDGDGRISLEDFRQMVRRGCFAPAITPALRAPLCWGGIRAHLNPHSQPGHWYPPLLPVRRSGSPSQLTFNNKPRGTDELAM